MTQAQFVETLLANLEAKGWEGLSKKDAKELCETIGETVLQLLKKRPPTGKNAVAVVPGVGRFTLAKRKARMGRNPATGEAIKIKASKKVRVTIQKGVRDALGSK
jgi:DNA-binding protein HU-beta